MKKFFLVYLLALMSACGGGGGNVASIPKNNVGGVTSTGDPLVAASVQAWNAEGKSLGVTTSNELGEYILPVGPYAPPLLLKVTPKDTARPAYYNILVESADTTGVRANINPISDLIVSMVLNNIQKNNGSSLEQSFSAIAPLINSAMFANSKAALNDVLAPIAATIAQSDAALSSALSTHANVTTALTSGAISGPLHTGLDNLLDQLQINKLSTQAVITLASAPTQPPIVFSTTGLGSQNSVAVQAANDAAKNPTTANKLQTAPPTVVISSAASWGTKSDTWAGYTGSMAIWVPQAVSGGWTLTFQSPGLAKQIESGGSFWNTRASIDKTTSTFTLTNPTTNSSVLANQVLSIGFSANGTLDASVDLTNCRFNGQPCALVAKSATDSTKTLDALLKNFGYKTEVQNTIQGSVNTSLNVGKQNANNGGPPVKKEDATQSGDTGSAKNSSSTVVSPITVTFSVPTPPWTGGYGALLTIKNTGTSTFAAGASGWEVKLKFPDQATAKDVFSSGPWNFVSTIATDGTVTLTPQTWGESVAPSGSIKSGFNGGSLDNLLKVKTSDNTKWSIVLDSSVSSPPKQAPVPPAETSNAPVVDSTKPNNGGGYVAQPLPLPPMPATSNFSLAVKGWGTNLEMGTVMIPEPIKDQPLGESGLKAIFKYAGDGGDGDPGAIYFGTKWGNLFKPDATKNSLEMAKRVNLLSVARKDAIMPVMVVYTAQLSGGPTAVMQDILDIPAGTTSGDTEFLKDHYANLIIETALMLGYRTTSNPNPGTILFNPDMLGALQQSDVINSTFRKKDGSYVKVNVRAKLQAAIDYVYDNQAYAASLGYTVVLPATKPSLPADLTDDIKGWFQSQNWVVKTFGQNAIPYGWQLNLWAQGTSTWIHGVNGDKNKPHTDATLWRDASGQVAAFLDDAGVYKGAYVPDFVAIDRYEFDDFREAARNINYAYDSQDWKNFLTYTRQISSYLQRPAMLWQVPASHILTTNESIPNPDYVTLHSGAAGSFFMGDPALGVGAKNAASVMRSIPLNGQPYFGGQTSVGSWLDLFPAYDWTQDQLQLTINSNVFSILWGGGNTMGVIETAATGNDGGWMMQRTKDYYTHKLKPLVRK